MQNNPVKELVAQMRDMAKQGQARLSGDQLNLVATVIETQEAQVQSLGDIAGRAVLIARLARTFGLTPVALPGGEAVKQFLRDYIDEGSFAPIPWPPADLAALQTFLTDCGCINVGGYVHFTPPAQEPTQ